MTSHLLWILSLCLGALGVGIFAYIMIARLHLSTKAAQQVIKLLRLHSTTTVPSTTTTSFHTSASLPGFTAGTTTELAFGMSSDTAQQLAASLEPPAWLNSGIAKSLLADEDRKLLDQAGISLRNGGSVFVASRMILAVAMPLLAILVFQPRGIHLLMYGFFGFGGGLMLPKWLVSYKSSQRREQVVEELPLFVDLLRLLQGVGLSIDQSLQILSQEFGSVLPVLSSELAMANQLYASGRSRDQSLQRLTHLSDDQDMTAVVNLLVQVDRHGGAVQGPLQDFGIRLREKRQARFKEKIGAITVKMTGVMVLTLLPALMVITAGPGFMAVIRSLSSMGGR